MKKLLSMLLALLVVLSGFPVGAHALESDSFRIAGDSRFDTSILAADALKDQLATDKFDTVVLASGTNFADALAGSYLAYVKKAPLLITAEKFGKDIPYTKINQYIKDNLTEGGTIYVLGGTAAVPEVAVADLKEFNIVRLAGDNRYLTNIEILQEAGVTNEDILVSTGVNYADSLSASGAKKPLLLVNTTGLSADQKKYLDELDGNNFFVLGGEAAVSEAVEKEIGTYGTVERLNGANRYETSAKIAEKFSNGASSVVLAFSHNFPDGLCGGPLAAALNAPILLTREKNEDYPAEFCKTRGIKKAYILGGTLLIPDESVEYILNSGEVQATEITLTADKYGLSTNDSDEIILYAETDGSTSSIFLYDADSGTALGELKDDGNYSGSGDDLPGDNVYSIRWHIGELTDGRKINFYAADENIKSNDIQIIVTAELTDQELTDLQTAADNIQTQLFETEGYEEMTDEERKSTADELISQLCDEDIIDPESLVYDEESMTYSFVYTSGVLGSLIIKEWNPEQNGAGYVQPIINNVLNETEREGRDGSGEETTAVDIESKLAASSGSVLGKALILWSFNQAWDEDSYRRPFYQTTESSWDEKGLETTVEYDTTVESFKQLKGNNVIVFSGHGAYTTYKAKDSSETKTLSSLLLTEKSTSSKDSQYSSDLKNFRVGKISVKGGTMYAILPDFFTYYYDSDDLDGSFVFAENCEFNGKNGNVVTTMADSIYSRSAETVIGFHNSVMATYSREFMKAYVDSLIDGSTTRQAFDAAVSSEGSNDYFTGREEYGPTAYPVFLGNDESRLANSGILNGDFELATTPVYWNQVGDTRVVKKLGALLPSSNSNMAILTTGIGSAEEDYLAGTEGSVLSQVVKIPANISALKFSYDFVSEEPMEFVGSKYDDTFVVQIVSGSGTETIYSNSINSAEQWYEIDNINFDGGDNTTYQTVWQNISCDISKYAGQVVNIRFMVYDVGDSVYDSAILLDNVKLN